jgi:predicted nucleic acid-binding protein
MLVDTSVWIDYFNGYASPQAERLAQAISDAESIVIPGLVLTEILLGLGTELEANKIADLLRNVHEISSPSVAIKR